MPLWSLFDSVCAMDPPDPLVETPAPASPHAGPVLSHVTSAIQRVSTALHQSLGLNATMEQATSSLWPITSGGSEHTFACQICLGLEHIAAAYAVQPCQHTFCRACLQGYVTSQIQDSIVAIQCPSMGEGGTQRCTELIAEDAVLELIDNVEVVRKFKRFKAARENPNLRECPKCEHPQVGSPEAPQMCCAGCGAIYCFAHSNAHPPEEPCEAYEARCTGPDTRELLHEQALP